MSGGIKARPKIWPPSTGETGKLVKVLKVIVGRQPLNFKFKHDYNKICKMRLVKSWRELYRRDLNVNMLSSKGHFGVCLFDLLGSKVVFGRVRPLTYDLYCPNKQAPKCPFKMADLS